jgi:hypothetical protein
MKLENPPHCYHQKTAYHYFAGTECIEECCCCGFSRSVWEQGESDWMMVDIDDAIEEIEKFLKGGEI